jgi:predicted nucleic acid-binding protein
VSGVADRAAVNASPLITLSRAGLVRLLTIAAPRVIVPRQVADEVNRKGPTDPAVMALRSESFFEVVDVAQIPESIAARDLGAGESAVLAWGLQNPTDELLLDDLAARRCGESLGLTVHGTLSLLVRGKQAHVIPSVRPALDDLRRAGIFVSERLYQSILAAAGERA